MNKVREVIDADEWAKQSSKLKKSREETFHEIKELYTSLEEKEINEILSKYNFTLVSRQKIMQTESKGNLEKRIGDKDILVLQILEDIAEIKNLDREKIFCFLKGKYPNQDEQIFYEIIDKVKAEPTQQNSDSYSQKRENKKNKKDGFGKRIGSSLFYGIISGSISTVVLPILYREVFHTRMSEELKWGSFFVFGGLSFLLNLLPDKEE